jgi:hypothetical protein
MPEARRSNERSVRIDRDHSSGYHDKIKTAAFVKKYSATRHNKLGDLRHVGRSIHRINDSTQSTEEICAQLRSHRSRDAFLSFSSTYLHPLSREDSSKHC